MKKPIFENYDQFLNSLNESLFSDSISKFKKVIADSSDFLYKLGDDYETLGEKEFNDKWSDLANKKIDRNIINKFEKEKLEEVEETISESLEINEAFSIFKQGKKLRKIMLGFFIFLQMLGLSINASAQTVAEELKSATEVSNQPSEKFAEKLPEILEKVITLNDINKLKKDKYTIESLLGDKIYKIIRPSKNIVGWKQVERGGNLEYKGKKVDITNTTIEADSKEMEKKFQWISSNINKLTIGKINLETELKNIQSEFSKRFKDSKVSFDKNNNIYNVTFSHKFLDDNNFAADNYITSTGTKIKKGDKIKENTIVENLNVGTITQQPTDPLISYALHLETATNFNLKFINDQGKPTQASLNLKNTGWFYAARTSTGRANIAVEKGFYIMCDDIKELKTYKSLAEEVNKAILKSAGLPETSSKPFGVEQEIITYINKMEL